MTRRPDLLDLAIVGAGGALGALLRWGLTDLFPTEAGFPLTTFAINVGGCLALALLPLVVVVRRGLLFCGTGVLGGFTTMSFYSEQTRALFAAGQSGTALVYLLGSLLAAIVAVNLAEALIRRANR